MLMTLAPAYTWSNIGQSDHLNYTFTVYNIMVRETLGQYTGTFTAIQLECQLQYVPANKAFTKAGACDIWPTMSQPQCNKTPYSFKHCVDNEDPDHPAHQLGLWSDRDL